MVAKASQDPPHDTFFWLIGFRIQGLGFRSQGVGFMEFKYRKEATRLSAASGRDRQVMHTERDRGTPRFVQGSAQWVSIWLGQASVMTGL